LGISNAMACLDLVFLRMTDYKTALLLPILVFYSQSLSGSSQRIITAQDSGLYLHVIHPKDCGFKNTAELPVLDYFNYFQFFIFGNKVDLHTISVYIDQICLDLPTINLDTLPLIQIPIDFSCLTPSSSSESYEIEVVTMNSAYSPLFKHAHTFELNGVRTSLKSFGSYLMQWDVEYVMQCLIWVSYWLIIGISFFAKIVWLIGTDTSIAQRSPRYPVLQSYGRHWLLIRSWLFFLYFAPKSPFSLVTCWHAPHD
jgi:hypothetical protein